MKEFQYQALLGNGGVKKVIVDEKKKDKKRGVQMSLAISNVL